MPNRSRQTFLKRRKEKERVAKQRAKELRRRERAHEKAADARQAPHGGPDPDLDGITPGPQEPIWKHAGVLTEEEVTRFELEEEEAKEREQSRA